MSLANWNVKEKEKFSGVADPVFCFSFSFLSFFFVIFFEKRFSVGQSLYSFDHCRLGFIVRRRPHCSITVRQKDSGYCKDCGSSVKNLFPKNFLYPWSKRRGKAKVVCDKMWLFFKAKT